jgi:hypothetical protein
LILTIPISKKIETEKSKIADVVAVSSSKDTHSFSGMRGTAGRKSMRLARFLLRLFERFDESTDQQF